MKPVIQEMSSIAALNESNKVFLDALLRNPAAITEPGNFFGNYVDVRDAAMAHRLALSVDEAGGERFIPSAGPFRWQDVCECLGLSPEVFVIELLV